MRDMSRDLTIVKRDHKQNTFPTFFLHLHFKLGNNKHFPETILSLGVSLLLIIVN